MGGINMGKLTRMQRSYRWQPHLPFMPVNIETNPWAKRLNYTFQTLPIVEVSRNKWILEDSVHHSWHSQASFLIHILNTWRHNLSLAPMSVDYLPDIRHQEFGRVFDTEKQARGYYWFTRSLMFQMYAEFAFVAAGRRYKWRDQARKFCEDNKYRDQETNEAFFKGVEDALCDFLRTKRAGVVIDTTKTQIWPFIPIYLKNGVPTFMHVGHVTFHDREQYPRPPIIHITNITGHTKYDRYPADWPNQEALFQRTHKFLDDFYEDRLGITPVRPARPLSLSRPSIQEIGYDFHQRGPTSSWVNPYTNNNVDFIQMAERVPADQPLSGGEGLDWVEFFDKRRKSNEKTERGETPAEKGRRVTREREAEKINLNNNDFPSSKRTKVFQWVQCNDNPDTCGMRLHWLPIWKRILVERVDVESTWQEYLPTQRIYDSFRNEWDLMYLFDVTAQGYDKALQDDDFSTYEDDDFDDRHDEPMDVDYIPRLDPDLPVAYLDQINVAPQTTPYSNVGSLFSRIAFIAPANLFSWVWMTLGLRCSIPLDPPLSFSKLENFMGFYLDDAAKGNPVCRHLEEFATYVVNRDFDNPRMSYLCDMDPNYTTKLDVSTAGLQFKKVVITRTRPDLSSSTSPGYILTATDDNLGFKYGWKLVVFNATSVVQIIRNRWGSRSMESLIRHLVCHGIEFRTIIPSLVQNRRRVVKTSPKLVDYKGIPAIPDIQEKRTVQPSNPPGGRACPS